jgi:hypothetical protein
LSPGLSHPTYPAAYTRFTPSKSGQRSPPTYYRGCWHVVSRGLFLGYRPFSSPRKGLYIPKDFVTHAASLHQGFPHCAISLIAAPQRSQGRVSVPVWLTILSDQLPVVALVGRYPTNKLIGRRPIPKRVAALDTPPGDRGPHPVLAPLSRRYSRLRGRLPTCYSTVRRSPGSRRNPIRSTCIH